MSFELPSLSLKINKEFKNENKNENINNIKNTIIFNKDIKDFTTELKGVLPEIIEKSQTPEIIKIFNEYLLLTLIDYFKNNLILLKNLLEICTYIVFKDEDIIKMIPIFLLMVIYPESKYESFYVQMYTEFNISLDYVLI
jgi:hypothetical protein